MRSPHQCIPAIIQSAGIGRYRTLRLFKKLPGVANLSELITFNAGVVAPTFVYNGKDATATTWPGVAGETLTLQAGTPTLNNGSPFLGADDDSVLPDGSTYYQAAAGAFANVSTDDIFIDGFVKGGAAGYIAFKKNGAGEGWYLSTTGTRIELTMEDAGTDTATVLGAANSLTPGQWNYFAVMVDKDEAAATGSSIFTNGATAGTGVDFSAVDDCDSAINFTLFADNAGATGLASDVAYLSMYQGAALWPGGAGNTTLFQAIARERCTRLTGFYPQKAAGTAEPVVQTRAFAAYTDKYVAGVRKLFLMGSDLLRMPQRYDGSNTVYGYLPEGQVKSEIAECEDCATTWTKIDAGDTVDANAEACPDGRVVADGIIADADDNQHGYQYVTGNLTAASTVFSVFYKPGDKSWVKLVNTTVANCTCYFNCTDGSEAVGSTPGAGVVASYVTPDWYNGFTRVELVFTGTVAAHTFQMMPCTADNDDDFAGDGSTTNGYFWGMQVEPGDKASSPILTDGATATRLKDQLRYKGDDGNLRNSREFTIITKLLMDNYDVLGTKRVFSFTDGGVNTDRISVYIDPSVDLAVTYTDSAEGNTGASGVIADIADGNEHTIRSKGKVDRLITSVDGVADATPDTDCGIPDDVDRLNIGMSFAETAQVGGLITGIDIYSKFTNKG